MTPFQLKISNEPVAVHLWELATNTPVTSTRVFDKIDGVILAFDAATASTFNSLETCLQRLFEVDNIYFKDNIPFTILQLKINRDLHQKTPQPTGSQPSSVDDVLLRLQNIEKMISAAFIRIDQKLDNLDKIVTKLEKVSSTRSHTKFEAELSAELNDENDGDDGVDDEGDDGGECNDPCTSS